MLRRQRSHIFRCLFGLLALLAFQVDAQVVRSDSQASTLSQPKLSLVYFLDASGKKTVDEIEQMAAAEFAAFSADKPIAIKNGALWLRFSATNQNRQQGLRLILPMATLDEATLYNRSADGAWIKQRGGDTLPMSGWAQRGRYPSFVLSDDHMRPVDYLLQLRHERGLYSTQPLVMSESAFITARQNEHLVLGMYFGLAALVVILALSRALVYRDMGFASYAIYVALLALTIATVSGISALYLWPEWPFSTVMSPALSSLTAVAADWFIRVVTRPKRFSRWLDRALLSMMVMSPLAGLLTIVQPSGWAYSAYSAAVLINTVVMFSAIVGALWQGDHDSRWVAVGFLPLVLALVVALMRNFGIISASVLTEAAIPIASAVEVIILFYGLHRRVSQRRSVTTRVTRLLQIDPLTGLDTRQALMSKLSPTLKASQRNSEPVALLLVYLANFDSIESKHGRESAERALVLAASCIRGAINPGDLLARTDVAQFALLLESPISEPEAHGIATKVLANVLRSENAVGFKQEHKLRFHMAIGYVTPREDAAYREAEPLLASLASAAQAVHLDATKTIVSVSAA